MTDTFMLHKIKSLIVTNENDKSRDREIVEQRQIAHYFAREYTHLSAKIIGKNIGNKDHATVLHSCKEVSDLCCTDKNFNKKIEKYRNTILGWYGITDIDDEFIRQRFCKVV